MTFITHSFFYTFIHSQITIESREGADDASPTGACMDNLPAEGMAFDVGADDASAIGSEPVGGVAVASCVSADSWGLERGLISIGSETAESNKQNRKDDFTD